MLAALPVLTNQFGGADIISQIISLVYILVFIVFMFYSQKIQTYIMIRDVEGSLHKLKYMKEEGRKTAIETIKEIAMPNT